MKEGKQQPGFSLGKNKNGGGEKFSQFMTFMKQVSAYEKKGPLTRNPSANVSAMTEILTVTANRTLGQAIREQQRRQETFGRRRKENFGYGRQETFGYGKKEDFGYGRKENFNNGRKENFNYGREKRFDDRFRVR